MRKRNEIQHFEVCGHYRYIWIDILTALAKIRWETITAKGIGSCQSSTAAPIERLSSTYYNKLKGIGEAIRSNVSINT